MKNGYDFYMDKMRLPMAPPSLKIEVGSQNKTVNLINEGEINILKSPSLTKVTFTARFPMRPYPYAPDVKGFKDYHDKICSLKDEKTPFQFIVSRTTPNGAVTWDTNLLVTLESYTINEKHNEGDDVLIDFSLKQYKPYKIKTVTVQNNIIKKPTGSGSGNRVSKPVNQQAYIVKSGDSLWKIAKQFYGNGSKWTTVYNYNKSAIEADAKKHGKASSSNGHWIWPGLPLTIPDGKAVNNSSGSSGSSSSTSNNSSSSSSSNIQKKNIQFDVLVNGKRSVLKKYMIQFFDAATKTSKDVVTISGINNFSTTITSDTEVEMLVTPKPGGTFRISANQKIYQKGTAQTGDVTINSGSKVGKNTETLFALYSPISSNVVITLEGDNNFTSTTSTGGGSSV